MTTFTRSTSLSTIPHRKLIDALESTLRNCPVCSLEKAKERETKIDNNVCKNCRIMNKAIHKYAESNIPVKYWGLEMDHHFYGDEILKEKYDEMASDIRKVYHDGIAYCFAGGHGRGKTMTCCNVLKRAVETGYSALYVNLNDIVTVTLSKDSDDRGIARKELLVVDFLVIDEFDPRYMPTDKVSDLFGKILEEIFRTRHQNGLPLLMCTNSPNVVESFTGNIKASIESLMSTLKMVPVLGEDFRKKTAKKDAAK